MKLNRKGFTLIELMIVVAIIGILAAIAIPNFIKFQARSKQSEPKANLKSLFTAQKSYMQEKDTYSDNTNLIGFTPERGNRYFYNLGPTVGACQERDVATLATGSFGCIHADGFKYTNPDATTLTPDPAMATEAEIPGAAVGIYTNGSVTHFTHSAVGNIDSELDMYDEWFISSESAVVDPSDCTAPSTENSVAGVPHNMNNDVNCDAGAT